MCLIICSKLLLILNLNIDLTVGGELDEADGGIVVVYQGLQTLPCAVRKAHGVSRRTAIINKRN
jgi:hypothetical protein